MLALSCGGWSSGHFVTSADLISALFHKYFFDYARISRTYSCEMLSRSFKLWTIGALWQVWSHWLKKFVGKCLNRNKRIVHPKYINDENVKSFATKWHICFENMIFVCVHLRFEQLALLSLNTVQRKVNGFGILKQNFWRKLKKNANILLRFDFD